MVFQVIIIRSTSEQTKLHHIWSSEHNPTQMLRGDQHTVVEQAWKKCLSSIWPSLLAKHVESLVRSLQICLNHEGMPNIGKSTLFNALTSTQVFCFIVYLTLISLQKLRFVDNSNHQFIFFTDLFLSVRTIHFAPSSKIRKGGINALVLTWQKFQFQTQGSTCASRCNITD